MSASSQKSPNNVEMFTKLVMSGKVPRSLSYDELYFTWKKNFDIKLPEIKLKTSEKDIFGSTPGIIPIEKETGTIVENLPRKTNETLFIVMPEIKRLKFRKDLISPRIDSISNDTETLYSTGFVH